MTKRSYSRPQIHKVYLKPEEAVFTACKNQQSTNMSGSGCPIGKVCHQGNHGS